MVAATRLRRDFSRFDGSPIRFQSHEVMTPDTASQLAIPVNFIENVAAVDLFCGAGGLTRGLLSARIRVLAGIDVDPHCKYAYESNNPGSRFVEQDVSDLPQSELKALFPEDAIKVLVGCAPCQSYSKYSQGKRARNHKKRWELLTRFAELVEEVRPDLVSMENVPELESYKVFKDFLEQLSQLEYHFSVQKVYCPDYGVPQKRERLVLLASRYGDIAFVPPTHSKEQYVTVASALYGLEAIQAGETCTSDALHRSSRLSPLNMERMKASLPGGTWRDWPKELLVKCHTSDTGKTYPSVYGRMKFTEPAPTLTTQFFGYGNGRFGHPEQNRAISLREGALLQSFPPDYNFVENGKDVTFSTIGRLIGNAVPPLLGKAVGNSIYQHLQEHGVAV